MIAKAPELPAVSNDRSERTSKAVGRVGTESLESGDDNVRRIIGRGPETCRRGVGSDLLGIIQSASKGCDEIALARDRRVNNVVAVANP